MKAPRSFDLLPGQGRQGQVGLAALALAALAAASLAQERRPIPAFPSTAEAITADVVVLDKDGRPVRGLTKEDFTLLEDGRPEAIVGFEARDLTPPGADTPPEIGVADERIATNEGRSAHLGRSLAFLVDDLGTQVLHMEEAKKAVARWLEEKADPRDEVTIATTSGDAWWSDQVGRGRPDLVAVLGRVQGRKAREDSREWMSDWEAYRITVYEDANNAAIESAGPTTTSGTGLAAAPPPSGQTPLGRTVDRVITRWLETGACFRTPDDPRGHCLVRVRPRAQELYAATARRIQAVLGAVERLSRGLAGARGRKSILVFSEGFLNDTHQLGFEQAIDASQRGNTAVYFIDARGLAGLSLFGADQRIAPQPGDVSIVNAEETLLEAAGSEYVAENTGGASIRNTNDLLGGLERVAEESSVYYLLGYQPEKSPDGKWHKLEVRVARPGVQVRARRGYQATPLATVKPPGPARKGQTRPLDPAVMAAADDDTIPLRIAPHVLEADRTGLVRVVVAIEIDTSKLVFDGTGSQRRAALDLTLLGMSRDRPQTFPVDERVQLEVDAKAAGGWLTLAREIRLPGGAAQVRALVRDVATGRAGTVTQRLVVPAFDKPYLATPVLTDRVQPTRRGEPPRLVPVAHRRFRPQGRLYCGYEVFGMTDAQGRATTRVVGGYTLQAAGGRVVRTGPSTTISVALEGRVIRMLVLPLDGLEEGDYVLVLEVVDQASGRTLVTHERFVLER